MFSLGKITSNRVLGGLFALMLLLAGVVFLTDSDVVRDLLRVLVPLSGIVFALVSLGDAESRIQRVAGVVLVVGCSIGIYLETAGAGVFSNPIVDIAIIASAMVLGESMGNDGPRSGRSSSRRTDGEPRFWKNPRSVLPSSESILSVALVLGSLWLLLDVMGIDVLASLSATVDLSLLLWVMGFGVLSKIVEVVRRRLDESLLERE